MKSKNGKANLKLKSPSKNKVKYWASFKLLLEKHSWLYPPVLSGGVGVRRQGLLLARQAL